MEESSSQTQENNEINEQLQDLCLGFTKEELEIFLMIVKKFAPPPLQLNILKADNAPAELLAKQSQFESDSSYTYLKDFISEHPDSYSEKEFLDLNDLLVSKGFHFERNELKAIINIETKNKAYLVFKNAINAACLKNLDEYLKKLASVYGLQIKALDDYRKAYLIFKENYLSPEEKLKKIKEEGIDFELFQQQLHSYNEDLFNFFRHSKECSLKVSFFKKILAENNILLKYENGTDVNNEDLVNMIITFAGRLHKKAKQFKEESFIEKVILWFGDIIASFLGREKIKPGEDAVLLKEQALNLEVGKKIDDSLKEYLQKRLIGNIGLDYLNLDGTTCCVGISFMDKFPSDMETARILVDVIYSLFQIVKVNIDQVLIAGYKIFIDSKGWEVKACFISVKADRETACSLNIHNLTPERILANFDFRHGYEKDKRGEIVKISSIRSHEESDRLYFQPSQGRVDLCSISPEQFELLIAHLLQKMEFVVEHTGKTGDGGIDIKAELPIPIRGGKFIIQCKRYDKDTKVDVKDVRDLFGVIHAEMANKGILITTSDFTSKAVDFAKGKPIELIDGDKLSNLLRQYLPEYHS